MIMNSFHLHANLEFLEELKKFTVEFVPSMDVSLRQSSAVNS